MQVKNLLLWSAVLILLTCCSSAQIQLEQVGGQKEVARGSRAYINWKFQNAEYVCITGDTTHYASSFQVYVMPTLTTTYHITAFSGSDSLETTWTLKVYEPDLPKVAQRGGDVPVFSMAPKASSDGSKYYSGYVPTGNIRDIAALKIVQVEYPDAEHKLLTLHTLILDKSGNQLSSLPADLLVLSLFSQCNAATTEYQPIISEEKWLRSETRMMMTICVDRSAISEEYDLATRKAISDFPFYLGSSDRLSVVAFNQESRIVSSHLSKDKLNNLAEQFSGEAQGLNAMFKSSYAALQRLEAKEKCKNVLVLITTGSDNASFLYTAEDIIQKAILRQTRIYTVGIGDMVDTYPLRYIASQTGGRYYSLPADHLPDLTSILREITYAVHGNYVLQIPMQSGILRACDSAIISLKLKTPDTTLTEHYSWTATNANTMPHYQALAMFGFRQTTVDDEYLPLLRSVAQVLKDNPTKIIELSGHSNAEGDEDAMRQLALERAQSVRKQLIDFGVNPTQLRGKALGDLKPIYYFQQNDWQKKFNRRVEVRWLDPSVQPYEIVAEYCYTETEAIKYAEQWEKRGFKVYYERVLVKGSPAFRVKLWGYPTEDLANQDASIIKKKFNAKVDVE